MSTAATGTRCRSRSAPSWPQPRKADLSRVTGPFVIGDRYDRTGKAQKSDIKTKFEVDAIHWAR